MSQNYIISMAAVDVSVNDVRQNVEVTPQTVSLRFACHHTQTHCCVQGQAQGAVAKGFV